MLLTSCVRSCEVRTCVRARSRVVRYHQQGLERRVCRLSRAAPARSRDQSPDCRQREQTFRSSHECVRGADYANYGVRIIYIETNKHFTDSYTRQVTDADTAHSPQTRQRNAPISELAGSRSETIVQLGATPAGSLQHRRIRQDVR